jgi:hypothetical protein
MSSVEDEVKTERHVACESVKMKMGACHLSPFRSTRSRCKRDLSRTDVIAMFIS